MLSFTTRGAELYNSRHIQECLAELEVTNKKVVEKAYEAFTPENRFKIYLCWDHGPPLKVMNVLRRILIDADNFGLLVGGRGWGGRG